MTLRTRSALLTLSVAIVLAAVPSAAFAGAGFTVPSGRTTCGLLTAKQAGESGAGLYCTSANIKISGEGIPAVRLNHSGKARKISVGNDDALRIEGDLPTAARPTLAYGKTWKRDGYTCTSRSSGLSCRRGAHGFSVSRESQRFF